MYSFNFSIIACCFSIISSIFELSASINKLENEKYFVQFNSNGDISSIFDKELGKEILKKPVTTGIFDYNGSSSWPAWELNFEELNREPQNTTKIKTIKVIENGPCRVALEIVKTFGNSTFTSVVALSRGGKVVAVVVLTVTAVMALS